jgi:hypothetical protein
MDGHAQTRLREARCSARYLLTRAAEIYLMNFVLRPSILGFVIVTRAALAFGVGLLVAGRIPEPRRRAIALTLIGIGAATTLPAVRAVLGTRTDVPALQKAV